MSAPPPIDRRDRSALRQFGILFGSLIALAFSVLVPWLLDVPMPVWPLLCGGGIVALALLWPPGIYPVYRAWLPIATAVGWINTRLILGLAFFVVVLPLGFVLRRLGKLQYRGTPPAGVATHRVERRASPGRDDMENPF